MSRPASLWRRGEAMLMVEILSPLVVCRREAVRPPNPAGYFKRQSRIICLAGMAMSRHFRNRQLVQLFASGLIELIIIGIIEVVSDDKSALEIGRIVAAVAQNPAGRQLSRVAGPHQNGAPGNRTEALERSRPYVPRDVEIGADVRPPRYLEISSNDDPTVWVDEQRVAGALAVEQTGRGQQHNQ